MKALDSKFTVDDNALYRHPDIAEMRDLEAYPPEERAAREKGVTYVKLDGEVGILGNGAGLVMSTLDVIALAGGRPANFCDLGGGGDAQGVVDALEIITRRPAGEVDPLQHLRRDHALRRGRARDPAGARPASTIEQPIVVRLDGTNAEEGRRLLAEAGAAEPLRRADDARRGEARGGAGGMTDTWSERAEAYARERGAPRGRGPRPARRLCEPGRGQDRARRRDRRRPRRAAAARGRASTSSRSTRRRACSRDVVGRAEDLPFADGSFDVVACRIAAHHFADVAPAVREMARVAGDRVVVEDNLLRRARRSRRPSGSATRRTSATTPRQEWREFFDGGGPQVEDGRSFEPKRSRSSRGSSAPAATARTRRARAGAARPTGSTARRLIELDAIVLKGRKRLDGDHRRPATRASSSRA